MCFSALLSFFLLCRMCFSVWRLPESMWVHIKLWFQKQMCRKKSAKLQGIHGMAALCNGGWIQLKLPAGRLVRKAMRGRAVLHFRFRSDRLPLSCELFSISSSACPLCTMKNLELRTKSHHITEQQRYSWAALFIHKQQWNYCCITSELEHFTTRWSPSVSSLTWLITVRASWSKAQSLQ